MNMSQENQPPNHLFKIVVVVSAAFVLTILLMIVTAFASIENPLVRFFNEHGLKLISVEVLLILVCAFAAMWLDGKQTNAAEQSAHDSDDENPNEQK
jgi:small neutral amino acid transporter SnatA (MarC family)